MLIDIIFAVLILLAVIKGYDRGLIIGVFSLIALIVGVAAAIKFSTMVASWLKDSVQISTQWLPILAFTAVFILAALLVHLGAKVVEKTLEVARLGWLNRMGGILFYAALYMVVFSVMLFYGDKSNLIGPSTIEASKTYSIIQPWGPKVINSMGEVIPVFRNMFTELENFFTHLSEKIPTR